MQDVRNAIPNEAADANALRTIPFADRQFEKALGNAEALFDLRAIKQAIIVM